jgi:hypothetical protein
VFAPLVGFRLSFYFGFSLSLLDFSHGCLLCTQGLSRRTIASRAPVPEERDANRDRAEAEKLEKDAMKKTLARRRRRKEDHEKKNREREKEGLSPLSSPADTSEPNDDSGDAGEGSTRWARCPSPPFPPVPPTQGRSSRGSSRGRTGWSAPMSSEGAVLELPHDEGTDVVLDVADDGSLGDPAQRQDVADGERGTMSAVGELARVQALGGDQPSLRGSGGSRAAQPSKVSKKRKLGPFKR